MAYKEPQKQEKSNDARFGSNIEKHIVGVINRDASLLNKFVVDGVHILERTPADSEGGMILNHFYGAGPHGQAHGHGRIGFTVHKNGHEAVCHAAVVKQQDERHEQKQQPKPLIPNAAEEEHQGCCAEPGAAGIRQNQAQGQQDKQANVQPAVRRMSRADSHGRSSSHDHEQEG